MRILALESSSLSGSVALFEDGQCVAVEKLLTGQRTAKYLAPSIRQALDRVSWPARQLDLLAVTEGPGSFTGLRAGVTTAKILAYAANAAIIGINTLEAIAAQAGQRSDRLSVILNAHRHELFVGEYMTSPDAWPQSLAKTRIVPIADWLSSSDQPILVSGPAVAQLGPLPDIFTPVDPSLWEPQAETVGRLAHHYFQQGRRDNPWTLTPEYYRLSAAEERWHEALPSLGLDPLEGH